MPNVPSNRHMRQDPSLRVRSIVQRLNADLEDCQGEVETLQTELQYWTDILQSLVATFTEEQAVILREHANNAPSYGHNVDTLALLGE